MEYVEREVPDDGRPTHERLQCFGYSGFGTGYEGSRMMTRRQEPVAAVDAGCNSCELRPDCWYAHMARVRTMFPDLTAAADEIAKTARGTEYVQRCMAELSAEPYLSVFAGNVQDGAAVACSLPFRARGTHTLTWPLTPVRPAES